MFVHVPLHAAAPVPVIVYVVDDCALEGVPLKYPESVSNDIPEGSVFGEIE